MTDLNDVLRACPDALLDLSETSMDLILQAVNRTVAYERAKYTMDTRRLDLLEKQGLIGIGHQTHGDYRHYAGAAPFKSLREVCDDLDWGEHAEEIADLAQLDEAQEWDKWVAAS